MIQPPPAFDRPAASADWPGPNTFLNGAHDLLLQQGAAIIAISRKMAQPLLQLLNFAKRGDTQYQEKTLHQAVTAFCEDQ